MSELHVRIVDLPPLRVAAALGFGPNPEELSMQVLRPWLEAHGVSGTSAGRRYFGFNNPGPSVGSPNYGYEQWVTAEPEEQGAGEVVIKQFGGGRYGVARCRLEDIQAVWGRLAAWLEDGRYTMGRHQWLEECLTPEALLRGDMGAMELDLYIPLAE
jgi:DNA gyrase inhibitor GyrI